MSEKEEILGAIAVNKILLDVIASGVLRNEGGLAELRTDVGRIGAELGSVKAEVIALRSDVTAHRMETRAAFNRHDERITALEPEPAQ